MHNQNIIGAPLDARLEKGMKLARQKATKKRLSEIWRLELKNVTNPCGNPNKWRWVLMKDTSLYIGFSSSFSCLPPCLIVFILDHCMLCGLTNTSWHIHGVGCDLEKTTYLTTTMVEGKFKVHWFVGGLPTLCRVNPCVYNLQSQRNSTLRHGLLKLPLGSCDVTYLQVYVIASHHTCWLQ